MLEVVCHLGTIVNRDRLEMKNGTELFDRDWPTKPLRSEAESKGCKG